MPVPWLRDLTYQQRQHRFSLRWLGWRRCGTISKSSEKWVWDKLYELRRINWSYEFIVYKQSGWNFYCFVNGAEIDCCRLWHCSRTEPVDVDNRSEAQLYKNGSNSTCQFKIRRFARAPALNRCFTSALDATAWILRPMLTPILLSSHLSSSSIISPRLHPRSPLIAVGLAQVSQCGNKWWRTRLCCYGRNFHI
jgi:hypothetical protein